MPKIIQNAREMLIAEARKQVIERGYSSVTVRSVAKACGLGIGTVYNYFSSKDMLIASFMAEDWQMCMESINRCCDDSATPEPVFRCIYEQLNQFIITHSALFTDNQAAKVFASVFTVRHKQLRSQLAEPISKICVVHAVHNSEFLSEFISESLLTWTVAGRSYEDIYSVLILLFK